jgi:N-acyl homoserine lactone hydrolase
MRSKNVSQSSPKVLEKRGDVSSQEYKHCGKSKKLLGPVLGIALAAAGAGMLLRDFLPQPMPLPEYDNRGEIFDASRFPSIEISFLQCGSTHIPMCMAVRGSFSLLPRKIAHSAVLIRHPQVTFLFDTGLCADISAYLQDQSFLFRQTLARFNLDCPLSEHLRKQNLAPTDLDFVLLSHLHWDHVSGLPDLTELPVRVSRVEYEAARHGLFDQHHNLVPRLIGKHQLELFDCNGPVYEDFHASYDLLGDGSLILVPLPGHTAGQVGMFVNRSNGPRLFLIADAAWISDNYLTPAPWHPWLWSRVTSDDASARQTLIALHIFSRQHPEVPLIAMHDGEIQDAFMKVAKDIVVT